MTGTLGGALEARGIPANPETFGSDAVGEIEKDGNVLIIKRIHVKYWLKLPADKREAADRAHRVHAMSCPVYRSIYKAIDITTELEMKDL
ncbi:MAG: OsmC family protein [Chloroflexi bacterium]|nr:OsmC family protein [Chloroflexota bacterium]